jgi:hypothetical protein
MDIVERRILTLTSVGHFFTHFTMLMFPPLATTIARDLGIGLDEVFSMSFMMYLFYGLGAVPWGYVSDRWSPRLSLATGMILAGFGLIGAAAVKNPVFLPIVLAVTGLGNAAYHPAGLSLLSKGMRSRGRGLGANGVWGNLGIAMAPFASGILGWIFGWRITFTIFGIAGIAAGAATVLIRFSVPRAEDRQRGEGPEGGKAVLLFLILCSGVIFSGNDVPHLYVDSTQLAGRAVGCRIQRFGPNAGRPKPGNGGDERRRFGRRTDLGRCHADRNGRTARRWKCGRPDGPQKSLFYFLRHGSSRSPGSPFYRRLDDSAVYRCLYVLRPGNAAYRKQPLCHADTSPMEIVRFRSEIHVGLRRRISGGGGCFQIAAINRPEWRDDTGRRISCRYSGHGRDSSGNGRSIDHPPYQSGSRSDLSFL